MKFTYDEFGNYRLGLVLAGAVSAGAYTGGAIDYLLNALELWKQEYEKDPVGTPKPNVILETITGASAGSIAAAVALLSLITKRNKPISLDEGAVNDSKSNLQYFTWVEMGLKKDQSILNKIFSTDDLEKGEFKSLLNTAFIDDLIDEVKKIVETSGDHPLPEYISKNIEILMTLSNLRGVPVKLSFSKEKDKVAHMMSYHKAFAHFKMNKEAGENEVFDLNVKSDSDLDLFLNCAKASGAFPLGLKSVQFPKIPHSYIEANFKEMFGVDTAMKPDLGEEQYSFLAVDGGMTNNEPIAEAIRILDRDNANKNGCIIMIDPFPNFGKKRPDYKVEKDSLVDILPQLLNTLRSQSLFKEKDSTKLFQEESRNKMIWPTRYYDPEMDDRGYDVSVGKFEALDNPIATGALGGFSGFFSKEFRHHDYFIGQKNCRSFLMYYFSQTEEAAKKLGWTDAQIAKWSIKRKGKTSETDKIIIPIIPDVRGQYLPETDAEKESVKTPEKQYHPNFPKYPQVNHDDLMLKTLKPLIKQRFKKLIDVGISKEFPRKKIHHAFGLQSEPEKAFIGKLIPGFMKRWSGSVKKWYVSKKVLEAAVPQVLDIITNSLAYSDLFSENDLKRDTRLNQEKKKDKENMA